MKVYLSQTDQFVSAGELMVGRFTAGLPVDGLMLVCLFLREWWFVWGEPAGCSNGAQQGDVPLGNCSTTARSWLTNCNERLYFLCENKWDSPCNSFGLGWRERAQEDVLIRSVCR